MKGLALLLALAVLSASSCGGAPAAPANASTARAAAWLWSRQAADGGWYGKSYGVLRPGHSLTALVLHTLLELPDDVANAPPTGAVDRALAFLRARTDPATGALGIADLPIPDYPNYATALATQSLPTGDLHTRMLAYLAGQQFQEADGWTADHPAYGGWGMGGPRRPFPHHGHLDLSMSRHVMEALATAAADATRRRALAFLDRCQGNDGGFSFSPVLPGANKAGRAEEGFQSYGTTTADGILGLLAMGATRDDPRVTAATEWLVQHHQTDRVPGFVGDPPGTWADGLRFYYLAASSRALASLGIDEAPTGRDWRTGVTTALAQAQNTNGSWRNWCALVKEDEPLIATCLALQALTAARRPAGSSGAEGRSQPPR